MPSTIWPVCTRFEPWSGRSETIFTVLPPSSPPQPARTMENATARAARSAVNPRFLTTPPCDALTSDLARAQGPRRDGEVSGDLRQESTRVVQFVATSGDRAEAPRQCGDTIRQNRPKWRNWQTRRTQNPVSFGTCGFDPHLRHPGESLQESASPLGGAPIGHER